MNPDRRRLEFALGRDDGDAIAVGCAVYAFHVCSLADVLEERVGTLHASTRR